MIHFISSSSILSTCILQHFTSNHDGETIVSNSMCPDLTARVLRFHPTQWNTSIAMRIDVVASRNGKITLLVLKRTGRQCLLLKIE